MPICPRCQNQVKATDLNCTRCGLQLKAHGHPSIELHQAMSDEVLCASCAYHEDDSCTFPQRPYAKACTLYQPVGKIKETGEYSQRSLSFKTFWQRYKIWLILLALFGVSLLLTLF